MNKNIILIGFMGSGKTTVGIQLSWKLKMPVDDSDKMIERKYNRSISDIFEKEGEPFFRQLETEMLRNICESNYSHIISLGGGTPVQPQNKEIIKNMGQVFYLRITPETVYERLKEDTTRPLLQCENPLERIRELIAKRSSSYEECADEIIDVDNMTAENIVKEIVSRMK